MTEEEKKDELKNRISMALKDPILQQGFEIICKNLVELKEQLDFIRDERNKFQEKCEDIELNYYCDHKGGCKAQDLETENNNLLDVINNQDVKIADLEQKLEQTEKDLADYQFNYPSIKELEKENAELKRNKKTVVHLSDCLEEKMKEQLTKAIEIIKGLLSCCRNYPQENAEKMKQAEQFLNSENIILEDAQAGNSPFDADEVFNKEIKAYSEEK